MSQSCMIAESTLHSASRRCAGSASTSPSGSELSTRAIAARESTSAPGSAVTAPSLIGCDSGLAWTEILELDRAVGQRDPWEDTRPTGDNVVRADRHALAQHSAALDARASAHPAARGDDAVPQHAALAD